MSVTDSDSALQRIEAKLDKLTALELSERIPSSLPGQRYGHLTYSQHGEDLVIVSLFEQLGIDRPSYIDIGAHHPLDCSNTAMLYNRGARGINVEANAELIEVFKQIRPEDQNVNYAVAAEPGPALLFQPGERSGMATLSREMYDAIVFNSPTHGDTPPLEVEAITINDLIQRYSNGKFPHFLSLDVEGLELDILKSADMSKNRPIVVCVEYINSINRDPAPLLRFMIDHGFEFAIRMFANLIFVDRDAAKRIRPSTYILSPM